MKYLSLYKLIGLAVIGISTMAMATPDNMEQRLAACAQCHGKQGQGVDDPKIPRLAGKPAGYLYKQLQAFKAGQRENPAMQYVVRQLSDSYLQQIAHYFSEQHVPYQAQAIPNVSAEVLKRGEALVKIGDKEHSVPACERCHGPSLTGVEPSIPGIIGQPYEYIESQLNLWKKNQRSTQSTHCMWVVANRMTESDVKAVSAWLASQVPPKDDKLITVDKLPQALPGWCIFENEVSL